MTKEEIKQLQDLQREIEEIKKAVGLLNSDPIAVRFPEYDRYYQLPIDRLSDLRFRVTDFLRDEFEEYYEELLTKRDELILCKEEDSPRLNYKPTEI